MFVILNEVIIILNKVTVILNKVTVILNEVIVILNEVIVILNEVIIFLNEVIVILNEVKDLTKILRLTPQNDNSSASERQKAPAANQRVIARLCKSRSNPTKSPCHGGGFSPWQSHKVIIRRFIPYLRDFHVVGNLPTPQKKTL